jgi:hypothetical protein
MDMGLLDPLREMFSDSPEWVGYRFEKYVLDLFNEKYYDIVERTHSHRTNEQRYVESSLNPDFTIRHKPSGQVFAVECKFRSGLDSGKLHWSNPQQLKRYNEFARERNIPVYIVIGFKGVDTEPEDMFVIPLEEAKYPALYPSVYNKYSRNPKKEFFWKNGKLF